MAQAERDGTTPERADEKPWPECGHYFHATTAMGYCPRCGGQWKNRHKRKTRAEEGGS